MIMNEMGILTRILEVGCELGALMCSVNKDSNRTHENYLLIENCVINVIKAKIEFYGHL